MRSVPIPGMDRLRAEAHAQRATAELRHLRSLHALEQYEGQQQATTIALQAEQARVCAEAALKKMIQNERCALSRLTQATQNLSGNRQAASLLADLHDADNAKVSTYHPMRVARWGSLHCQSDSAQICIATRWFPIMFLELRLAVSGVVSALQVLIPRDTHRCKNCLQQVDR